MRHPASTAALAAALCTAPLLATNASAATDIGLLTCNSQGSTGFIIKSSENLTCTFRPVGNKPAEVYSATLNKFGLDIGVTGKTVMEWGVLSTGGGSYAQYGLAGSYSGASAQASAVIGGGANILVGGGGQYMLQPVSLQAQTGINAAIGVSRFTLSPAEAIAPRAQVMQHRTAQRAGHVKHVVHRASHKTH